jgi:hypothetical protein
MPVDPTADRIDRLEAAQELLFEAWELLRDVAHETNDGYYTRYLVNALRVMIDERHDFLAKCANVEGWVETLRKADGEEESSLD